MSLIDDFLNNSHDEVDATMGTKTMVCNGQTFSVVWDDYSSDSDGGLGGLCGNSACIHGDWTSTRWIHC